jgi:hypothetical protein
MVEIVKVNLVNGGSGHEHIAQVEWRNPADGETGRSSRAEMVDFIANKSGVAQVNDGRRKVDVKVVTATPPYLRTQADGFWTDNLLALPRF